MVWYIKGKVIPYSLPSVGPGADPSVQAVSPQVTCHYFPPGLPVTFPAEEHNCPSAGTKLYCLVTKAHACEQLAQGYYLEAYRSRFKPAIFWIASKRSTVKPHMVRISSQTFECKLKWLFRIFFNVQLTASLSKCKTKADSETCKTKLTSF